MDVKIGDAMLSLVLGDITKEIQMPLLMPLIQDYGVVAEWMGQFTGQVGPLLWKNVEKSVTALPVRQSSRRRGT